MPATVSVLMACFNAERYVREAISSVLAQSHADFELVIVDDASSDRSCEMIQGFDDPRIKLVHQNHEGAARARNRAFANSSGDYVLYLDADDLVGPSHLEGLLQRIEHEPDCIAVSRWDRFKKDPSEATFPSRQTECDLPGPEWLELDWQKARPMTQSGMLLIPRGLIDRHGGWNEDLSLHDDFEFFARIISRCEGIRFAPKAKLYYRSGIVGSLSNQRTPEAVLSAHLSMTLGTSHLLEVRDTPRTREVCANILMDFNYTYYPRHPELRRLMRQRAKALGGATLEPDGPPGFHRLRKIIGWRAARRVQHAFGR